MDLHDLVESWRSFKLASPTFYQLREPYAVEYEFRGPQWGHPSNYARVRFACAPAETLSLSTTAAWPAALDSGHSTLLERAVGCAAVEGLLCSAVHPYRGCALTLVEVGWDDVMSSQVAFWIATRRAMGDLTAKGPWQLVHGPT